MRSGDGVLVGDAPRSLPPGWVARPELALFLAAYLLYDAGRWLFAGHAPAARAHADWIIRLERSAHVAVEGSVQRALEGPAVSYLLSTIYLAAQLVVLPGALIWLHRRSRPVYRRLRDTVIATWVIAVPVYALFPVAPPRLAGIGMADTVSHHAAVALTGHSTVFYNRFAAVPSLHVGFAFAVGIAVASATSKRWLKVAGHLWGPTIALAVVATGNHYVFDIVAGMVAAAIGYGLGKLVAKGTTALV
jgi:hypothetical protein